MFVRGWIRDIRQKTSDMSRTDKVEYIAEYYWYHILLTFLAAGVLLLIVYNFTFGRQTVSFKCAVINEETDDERDAALEENLAQSLDLKRSEVQVDSAYQVSYEGHEIAGSAESTMETGGTDYTGYDKFFFGWANGELDAVILPESLLQYCEKLGGELRQVDAEGNVSIALQDTSLAEEFADSEEDPMVVAFPANGKHEEAAGEFLRYLQEEQLAENALQSE